MSDMFGAPIGIGAAETDMRQNVLGALQAQKILGEIEKQPADKQLAEAHARLYGAEADLKQAQVADQRTMQQLAEGVAAARKAAKAGEVLTADAWKSATLKPSSQAEPYEEMLALAVERGVSPMVTEKLAKDATAIRKNEATAANALAEQQVRLIDAQAKRAERLGELALAGKASPQQYAMIRMQAASEGFPVDSLPQDWNAAKPFLDSLITMSMKAKDKLKLDRDDAAEKVKEALWKAQTGKANVSAKLAKQRTLLAEQEYDFRAKNDGERSSSAAAARESMNRRRDVLNLKELDAAYPQAPADPKLWKEGQKYRIGDTFFTARKGPDGAMGGEPIKDIPPSLLALARKPLSKNAQGADGADDESDDDGDD